MIARISIHMDERGRATAKLLAPRRRYISGGPDVGHEGWNVEQMDGMSVTLVLSNPFFRERTVASVLSDLGGGEFEVQLGEYDHQAVRGLKGLA